MKKSISILSAFFRWLVSLFPRAFRDEFGEEMLLDFTDELESASLNGFFSISMVMLRELRDIPINLLKSHWQEGRMLRILRSQPVNHALRGSLGFGVVFALTSLISWFVMVEMVSQDAAIIGNLQAFYFELFHTEHGLEFISWIPIGIGSLLTGLALGILFAVLYADRSKYGRTIVAGMLGWFLSEAIRSILDSSTNLVFFLGSRNSSYLHIAEAVLSGAFLALAFVVAKSGKRAPLRWLVVGSFAYPLVTYFYLQLLFKLSIIEAPWMFIALMLLMVVYMGSVFVLAFRSGVERKTIGRIAAGVLGYYLLTYVVSFFLTWVAMLIPYPELRAGTLVDSSAEWRFIFRLSLNDLIFGMILGLIMGLMFWFQKKSSHPQIMA